MHVSSRSYLTAGIAALGVGALALAPIQPIPNQVAFAPQRVVENLAVELAASSIDPITPWVTTFETAGANIATLAEFYLEKPFPILQTIGANIATYIEELGNGNAGLIPEQIWNNVVTFFEAPWDPGFQIGLSAPPDFPDETLIAFGEFASNTQPADGSNSPVGLAQAPFQLWAGEIERGCGQDGSCTWPQAATILNFLNTPYSGQVIGLLGPLLAPIAVLTRSFTAIGEFFEAGDVIGAINELINIPANLVNGVLNGAGFIDLTAIVGGLLPVPGIEKIGLNLGGLLTATPLDGSLSNPDNPPTQYSGGIGIDGIAANVFLEFGGIPVGWFGSSIGLGQLLSDQMLVTPPEPPAQAASDPGALPAPLDPAEPGPTEAPAEVAAAVAEDIPAVTAEAEPVAADAVTDNTAEETAPALAEVTEAEATEAEVTEAEATEAEVTEAEVTEAEAAVETDSVVVDVPEVEAELAEVEAADDPAPKPAVSVGSDSDDAGDTGSRASNSRRGAGSAG